MTPCMTSDTPSLRAKRTAWRTSAHWRALKEPRFAAPRAGCCGVMSLTKLTKTLVSGLKAELYRRCGLLAVPLLDAREACHGRLGTRLRIASDRSGSASVSSAAKLDAFPRHTPVCGITIRFSIDLCSTLITVSSAVALTHAARHPPRRRRSHTERKADPVHGPPSIRGTAVGIA